MKTHFIRYGVIALLIFAGAVTADAGDWFERTESHSIPVGDAGGIDFENIDFTRFEYRGDAQATEVSISITYKVYARERETAEDVLDRFSLDIDRSGDVMTIDFNHPQKQENKFFAMLLHRGWKKWKAEMTVTGPVDTDMKIAGDFSDLNVRDTVGKMVVRADFSETRLKDHTGILDANVEFGSLVMDRLNGGFNVSCEFGDAELSVVNLTHDSSLGVEFGSGDLHLPVDAGVSFVSQQSFGDVDFHVAKPVYLNGKKNNITLNDGGVNVRLNVEFGDINVTDKGSTEISSRW